MAKCLEKKAESLEKLKCNLASETARTTDRQNARKRLGYPRHQLLTVFFSSLHLTEFDRIRTRIRATMQI